VATALAPVSRVAASLRSTLRFSLGLRPSLDTGLSRDRGASRERHWMSLPAYRETSDVVVNLAKEDV